MSRGIKGGGISIRTKLTTSWLVIMLWGLNQVKQKLTKMTFGGRWVLSCGFPVWNFPQAYRVWVEFGIPVLTLRLREEFSKNFLTKLLQVFYIDNIRFANFINICLWILSCVHFNTSKCRKEHNLMALMLQVCNK